QAALKQPFDRLSLEACRKPTSRSPGCHLFLLQCWGSLANPPLLGGSPHGRAKNCTSRRSPQTSLRPLNRDDIELAASSLNGPDRGTMGVFLAPERDYPMSTNRY